MHSLGEKPLRIKSKRARLKGVSVLVFTSSRDLLRLQGFNKCSRLFFRSLTTITGMESNSLRFTASVTGMLMLKVHIPNSSILCCLLFFVCFFVTCNAHLILRLEPTSRIYVGKKDLKTRLKTLA